MSESKKQYPDPLVRQRLFPDAAQVFAFAPVGLAEALKQGIVVVDTNVLLVPYTTGRASLEQIRLTYERLVAEGRIRIPGQVAREFADHRAEKLKTLYQQLSRKRDTSLARSEYPLLEGLPAYADVVQREADIANALGEYRRAVASLLETVAAWNWDDPVSLIYRQLFSPDVIIDPMYDREELLKELRFRQEHRIPPGYKDATNEYSGVGDLLIWKAILEIGKKTTRDVVFVSGDEKTDWRYQSENTALYPRFELLQEYRAASGGRSLLITSFAALLEQFGVPATVVEEIRKEEAVSALTSPAERNLELQQAHVRAERAALRWLLTQFPHGHVHSGDAGQVDFVASDGDMREAYEIKYVRRSAVFHRHIREWVSRIGRYMRERSVPVSLVIVVDDIESVNQIARHAPFGLGPGNGLAKLIVGTLSDDDVFHERYRLLFDEENLRGR
jgi:hypothetical protein